MDEIHGKSYGSNGLRFMENPTKMYEIQGKSYRSVNQFMEIQSKMDEIHGESYGSVIQFMENLTKMNEVH